MIRFAIGPADLFAVPQQLPIVANSSILASQPRTKGILGLLVIRGFLDIYRLDLAQGSSSNRYCSFAYSALASFRMGVSESASFQSVRKS